MKKRKQVSYLFISFFLVSVMINLNGQNSSGWRGEYRNGTVEGFNVPAKWPDQLMKRWEVKVGECDASPVLSEGRIYLHVKRDNSETVLSLDANNGKELWSTILNPAPEVTGPSTSHPGPRSTPCIADGKLFTLGAGGMVNCLDVETGKVIWSNNTYTEVPQFFTGSSPLVVGNMCIIQLGGRNNGVVVAFDAKSGKEMWKLENVPCTYSSPVSMDTYDNLFLIQSETDLHGVSTGGEVLWKIPTPVLQRFYSTPTPTYKDNILVVTGQGSGTKAYSLNKTSWEYEELWSNSELGTSFNTPLIKDGFVYGNEARLGKLFCLDMKTGETMWQDTTTLNRFASILDLGDALISLTANGTLTVFEPNGVKYAELEKYDIATTDVYAHPLFVRDMIYVKDKEMLTCWSIL
jgi:outer membrane protein assembly factor BamB